MAGIIALGYIGCSVSSLAAWDDFLESVFSLRSDAGSNDQVRHFSVADDRRLALTKANHDGLSYVGWEVETHRDLCDLEHELQASDTECVRGDAALCKQRGVSELLVLAGPDGVRTELYCGRLHPASAPEAGGISRPASALRLGHVVLACGNRVASMEWYQRVLGLSLSDQIFWDDVEASFLRCNAHHHSLALTNPVGDMRGGELGHFMLEAASLDDVGRAYDVVRRRGVPIAFTLGRHSNDQSISFYVYSPSGWLVEYGYGARVIDDAAWEPKLYDAPSIWGHERQAPPGGDQQKQRY